MMLRPALKQIILGPFHGNDVHTKLLLNCDGSDASTTFFDRAAGASTPHNGTAVGNAQVDTGQSKFGDASLQLDGTGDYLTTAGHADFNIGTGDFTIDFWIRYTSGVYIFDFRIADGAPVLYLFNSGSLTAGIGAITMTTTVLSNTGTWVHIAIVRSGSTVYLFKDGVQVDSDTSATSFNISGTMYWGARNSADNSIAGWLDEIRFSTVARWTAAFTPPTAPYL